MMWEEIYITPVKPFVNKKGSPFIGNFLLCCLFCFICLLSKNVYSEIVLTSEVPTNIGLTTVRLNAIVGVSAESTLVNVDYGTSASNLDTSTSARTIRTPTSSFVFSEFISGLQCGTEYYYSVSAINSGVATSTSVNTFTTLDCVSIMAVISTGSAQSISQASARLLGNISLDKEYPEVSYYFEYGLDTSYGQQTTSQIIPRGILQEEVDVDIFDLDCSSTYNYRLVVILNDGSGSGDTVNEGDNSVFSTLECNQPELLSASLLSTSATIASVSMSFVTYGREVDVFFEWGETSELGQVTPVRTVQGGTLDEQLTNLNCGSPYYFLAVLRVDNADIRSDTKSFSTKPCSQRPTVQTLEAIEISKNSAVLNANVKPNEAATTVYFEWGATNLYGSTTNVESLNTNLAGQIIRTDLQELNCETQYFYKAIAENENGRTQGDGLSFITASCDSPDAGSEPVTTEVGVKIFAGENHSIALGKSGEVILWGNNDFSQLGGPTDDVHLIDGLVSEAPIPGKSPLYFDVLDAAAGGGHSIILHPTQNVMLGFGNNSAGQLGSVTNNQTAQYPTLVVDEEGNSITNIVDVAAGKKHSVALHKDGFILLWGDNSFGQLSVEGMISSVTPLIMETINNAIQIEAGDNYTLAILQDDTLVAWGANQSGQLGIGEVSQSQFVTVVPEISEIDHIAAGAEHVLALRENGAVLVWGNNEFGQLGNGNKENQPTPIPLRLTDAGILANVIQLAAGEKHSVALLEDGRMLAWGDNSFGQLGIESMESVSAPTEVVAENQQPIENIISIDAGANFTIALDSSGVIRAWGDNSLGQLNGRISPEITSDILKDRNNGIISLSSPRIIVSSEAIEIERGSVAKIKVRLSSKPEANVVITAKFDESADAFGVERGGQLYFGPTNENWAYEQILTLNANSTSDINEGVLNLSSPGFSTVPVQVKIASTQKVKPKEQVVGSLSPIHVSFLLALILVLFRIRFK